MQDALVVTVSEKSDPSVLDYLYGLMMIYEFVIIYQGQYVLLQNKGEYALTRTIPLMVFVIVIIVFAIISGLRAPPLPQTKENK